MAGGLACSTGWAEPRQQDVYVTAQFAYELLITALIPRRARLPTADLCQGAGGERAARRLTVDAEGCVWAPSGRLVHHPL